MLSSRVCAGTLSSRVALFLMECIVLPCSVALPGVRNVLHRVNITYQQASCNRTPACQFSSKLLFLNVWMSLNNPKNIL